MNEVTNIGSLPNNYVQDTIPVNQNPSSEIYNKVHLETSEIPRNNIPISTEKITTDVESKVNFVPESNNDVYYIPQNNEINNEASKSESLFENIKNISYEDLRLPLLVGLLYIIFTLNPVQDIIKNLFKFGYDENGNATSIAIYVQGVLFGCVYFLLSNIG